MAPFIVIAACLLASVSTSAWGQLTPERPGQRYQLFDGSVIEHLQYEGVLQRLDPAGRQLARVKIPKSRAIDKSTRIVVSESEANLLVVHNAGSTTWPP